MQRNYYISILESVYKEYGLEIFLQRLAKILNIHLEIKDSKVPVTFSQDRILINTENPITIDFIDESYHVTKYFSDYKTMHFYSKDKREFKKSFTFPLENNEELIVEEINEQNIKSTRLLKTSPEDSLGIKGTFEKEKLHLTNFPLTENYTYHEETPSDQKVTKVVDFARGLYYYSYHRYSTNKENQFLDNYTETSMSLKQPYVSFTGRVRNSNELLQKSINIIGPNILIVGVTSINNSETLFEISIVKQGYFLNITYKETELEDFNVQEKSEHVIGQSNEEFTILEIDVIEKYLKSIASAELFPIYDKELAKIKQQIQIKKNKALKDVDIIDFKLASYDTLEYLAYDIHENLPFYINYIISITNPESKNKSIVNALKINS